MVRIQALDVTAFDSRTPLFFSELFLFQLSMVISKEVSNKFIGRESFHFFLLLFFFPFSALLPYYISTYSYTVLIIWKITAF